MLPIILHFFSIMTVNEADNLFFGVVNWIAGIVILAAAIYLPFQIGGIGQSIFKAFGNMYKQGMDATKSAGKTAWKAGEYGLNKTATGFQIKTAIEKSPVGQFFAGFTAEKKKAETELEKAQRMNQLDYIGSKRYATGDSSLDKPLNKLTDRSTMDIFKTQKTVADIEKYIEDEIESKAGWQKLLNGQWGGAEVHENATNAFGALKYLSLYSYLPSEKEAAENLLNKYSSLGIGANPLGIVSRRNDPQLDLDSGTLLMKKSGLDERQISDIISGKTTTIPQQLQDKENFIVDYLKIKDPSTGQYVASNITNLNDFITNIKAEYSKKVDDKADGFINMYQNKLSVANLEYLRHSIQPNENREAALHLIQQLNVPELKDSINKLEIDKLGNFKENSLNQIIFDQALSDTINAKNNINSTVKNVIDIQNNGTYNPQMSHSENTMNKNLYNLYHSFADRIDPTTGTANKSQPEYLSLIDQNQQYQKIVNNQKITDEMDRMRQKLEYIIDKTNNIKYEFFRGNNEIINMINQNKSGKEIVSEIEKQNLLKDFDTRSRVFNTK